MSERKAATKRENTKGFEPIVSSQPRTLKSAADLRKPNAYRNDWTQVASLRHKQGSESK